MIYHGTFDLDYILRMTDDMAGSMLKDRETGRTLRSEEVKAHAAILKARGFEVLPCCDHHDATGQCLGHESAPPETK